MNNQTKIKCPKCDRDMEVWLNVLPDKDYVEVELCCTNDHMFFTRVKKEDLIEEGQIR